MRRPSSISLGHFTELGLLIPRLAGARKDSVIRELTRALGATQRIDTSDSFCEALLAREELFPTFVGRNVAVPHLRIPALKQLSLAVGLSPLGIPWGQARARIANVVFLFAIPSHEGFNYIRLLSGLASLVYDEKAFDALQGAAHPEQMLSILTSIRLVERVPPRAP